MKEFLLQKDYVKREQLDEAEKVQKQTNEPDLGRVLIQLGFVGEREVLMAKAQEAGIGFVDLDRINVESSAINVVPERIAKNHNVVPVKKDGTTLWLAMTNVNNIMAIDDVKMASGCRVIPLLAVAGAIDDALRKYYGGAATNGAATNATPAADASAGASSADMRRLLAEASVGRTAADDETTDADAEKMAEQAPIIKLAGAIIQQAIFDRPTSDFRSSQRHPRRASAEGRSHPVPHRRRFDGGDERSQEPPGTPHQPPEDHGGHEHR